MGFPELTTKDPVRADGRRLVAVDTLAWRIRAFAVEVRDDAIWRTGEREG